jgi:hypothetical protein
VFFLVIAMRSPVFHPNSRPVNRLLFTGTQNLT